MNWFGWSVILFVIYILKARKGAPEQDNSITTDTESSPQVYAS